MVYDCTPEPFRSVEGLQERLTLSHATLAAVRLPGGVGGLVSALEPFETVTLIILLVAMLPKPSFTAATIVCAPGAELALFQSISWTSLTCPDADQTRAPST